ncbi:MAG: menaquinone biosynthesis decarboxylase [Bacteroidales bacterium]|jgi:4-hydroxy-3-polyprenylbenzoate decarboxylase|nr:menaquinone biosynthesis decarboxylase [Bacteroidales bacterium]MDD4213797.1 menaquinone biosynthesis decarboxylase [Bacteroidales bacterium]
MPYKNLSEFIAVLEKQNELHRIKEFISPKLEISEISDRVVKSGGKALLFENTGTDFPLLINAFGSEKRMCLALGIENLDEIKGRIDALFKNALTSGKSLTEKLHKLSLLREISSWMPKTISGKGKCQEKIMPSPDITKLPVLTCWPHDGGPFITLPVVHTQDPVSGMRNVGMYRMQVFSACKTAMHWHLHKNSARHFHEYKKLKKKMPVSVTLGGDPIYTYVATAPLPDNMDEYLLAGFLRKKRVKLVKCLTNELYVPEDVDFVIEGYIDPEEELITEGPFGDHTGFYSLPEPFPVFHITCITHRKDAIYPATIVGIPPMEDAWLGKATERIFTSPIKYALQPEIIDIHMPVEGVFHNLVLVKIKNIYQGIAQKIINGLWGAGQMMFSKIIIVLDENADIFNYPEVVKAISENVNISSDIIFSKGPADILDHSAKNYAFQGKIGIDATVKKDSSLITPSINKENLSKIFDEIVKLNDTLLHQNINAVIISYKKSKPNHTRILAEKLITENILLNIQSCFFLDFNVEVDDLSETLWLLLNNIDPARDIFIISNTLCFDGTRKTKELDNFQRPWPNVIVMDDETIKTIDNKWEKLGLDKFSPSPSLKYKKLLWPGKAEAE